MTMELTDKIMKLCDCRNCESKNKCPHEDSFRRYPAEYGGTGACRNLKK